MHGRSKILSLSSEVPPVVVAVAMVVVAAVGNGDGRGSVIARICQCFPGLACYEHSRVQSVVKCDNGHLWLGFVHEGGGDAGMGLKCKKSHLQLVLAYEGGGRHGNSVETPSIHPGSLLHVRKVEEA